MSSSAVYNIKRNLYVKRLKTSTEWSWILMQHCIKNIHKSIVEHLYKSLSMNMVHHCIHKLKVCHAMFSGSRNWVVGQICSDSLLSQQNNACALSVWNVKLTYEWRPARCYIWAALSIVFVWACMCALVHVWVWTATSSKINFVHVQ